jgi:hypothetical protein
MTQDFRHNSPKEVNAQVNAQTNPQFEPQKNVSPAMQTSAVNAQSVVFTGLRLSAALFAVAGIWLLTMPQTVFSAELTPILGGTFLLVAVADLLAVGFLKRAWSARA